MTVVALIQDPHEKGGAATLVRWYREWMVCHRSGPSREFYLDEARPGGVRAFRQWSERDAVPRFLPRLHVPQYSAARRLLAGAWKDVTEVHVVGASVMHGVLAPDGLPTIVWIATALADERKHRAPYLSPARRLLYWATLPFLARFEKQVLSGATRILTTSHHTADVLAGQGIPRERMSVLPVPVDTEEFIPSSKSRHGVLFVGRVHDPRKGYIRARDLVVSSERVRERGLTIVSPGEPPPDLPSGVSWLGQVSNLAEVMASAELLILPSRQEGLGIVVFEALSCETPVVAFRCGGPDVFLTDSGGGILVDDQEEFRRSVELLLGSSDLREQMGKAGRTYVQNTMSARRFMEDPTIFELGT